MTDFGDTEPDDAFDPTGPLDPEQVARRLQELRIENGLDVPDWDDLTPEQRLKTIAAIIALIAWLGRQGALR